MLNLEISDFLDTSTIGPSYLQAILNGLLSLKFQRNIKEC